MEKADLTESDEDDDDDEDELEVIESGAKKLLDYFIGNKCYLFADMNVTSIYIFFASRSLLLTSIAIPSVSQLLLLGKFEYTGGPIFKVVLEC